MSGLSCKEISSLWLHRGISFKIALISLKMTYLLVILSSIVISIFPDLSIKSPRYFSLVEFFISDAWTLSFWHSFFCFPMCILLHFFELSVNFFISINAFIIALIFPDSVHFCMLKTSSTMQIGGTGTNPLYR